MAEAAGEDPRAVDPTGYATLQEVLGERDLAAFQKRWERYVAGLVFDDA